MTACGCLSPSGLKRASTPGGKAHSGESEPKQGKEGVPTEGRMRGVKAWVDEEGIHVQRQPEVVCQGLSREKQVWVSMGRGDLGPKGMRRPFMRVGTSAMEV